MCFCNQTWRQLRLNPDRPCNSQEYRQSSAKLEVYLQAWHRSNWKLLENRNSVCICFHPSPILDKQLFVLLWMHPLFHPPLGKKRASFTLLLLYSEGGPWHSDLLLGTLVLGRVKMLMESLVALVIQLQLF